MKRPAHARYVPELAYRPEFYSDELLYSYLARYHRHSGASSYSDTAHDLFGRDVVKASMAVPTGLDALAERLDIAGIDGTWLARCATLYNYYAAFSEPEIAERALAMQRKGNSPASVVLGLAAFWLEQPKTLRFCRECLVEMLKDRGEYWWLRSHQLPGVLVCPDHGCILQEADVHFAKNGLNALIAASPLSCSPDRPKLVERLTPSQREFALDVARRSRDLLVSPRSPIELADRRGSYASALFAAGLMRSGKMVDLPAFMSAAKTSFGGNVGLLVPRLETNEGIEQFGADLLRAGQRARHPLLHILMERLIEGVAVTDPFGVGPWECLNPVGGHYKVRRITDMRRQRRAIGGMTASFICECGHSYYLTVDADGTVHKPKLRSYGPTLDPALRSLFADGCNQREISCRLQLHPRAVAAAAHRLGLSVDWKRPVGARLGSSEAIAHQSRVRNVTREPNPRPRRVPGPRKDWNGMDQELCARIDDAANAIRTRRPWHRVTEMAIERELGSVGRISYRREKLPLTVAKLRGLIETREDFLWRRVHAVVDDLKASGVPLKRWVVLKKAGVRREYLPLIAEYLAAIEGAS